MTAASLRTWRATDRTSDARDLTPLVMSGILLAMFAFAISIVIDLVILVPALAISGASETGNPWPTWGVAAIGVVAVIVSVAVGYWLYGLRRSIGGEGDPMDHDTLMRKRRAFVVSAMTLYVLLAPCVWLMMIAFATSP